MVVQCKECETSYQLDAERVPRKLLKVRCPKCRAVFAMDGRRADEPGAAAPAPTPPPAARADPASYGEIQLDAAAPPPAPRAPAAPAAPEAADPAALDLQVERTERPAPAPGPSAPAPAARPSGASAPAPAATATAEPEPAADSGPAPRRRRAAGGDDKPRRLARALVSDILVYNREARDKALAEGNLVQALGQEIKKSWELYKEKVTPEVANSTNHFREALNEILADGQKIF